MCACEQENKRRRSRKLRSVVRNSVQPKSTKVEWARVRKAWESRCVGMAPNWGDNGYVIKLLWGCVRAPFSISLFAPATEIRQKVSSANDNNRHLLVHFMLKWWKWEKGEPLLDALVGLLRARGRRGERARKSRLFTSNLCRGQTREAAHALKFSAWPNRKILRESFFAPKRKKKKRISSKNYCARWEHSVHFFWGKWN